MEDTEIFKVMAFQTTLRKLSYPKSEIYGILKNVLVLTI